MGKEGLAVVVVILVVRIQFQTVRGCPTASHLQVDLWKEHKD